MNKNVHILLDENLYYRLKAFYADRGEISVLMRSIILCVVEELEAQKFLDKKAIAQAVVIDSKRKGVTV